MAEYTRFKIPLPFGLDGLRRRRSTSAQRRPKRRFQPRLEVLEERTVPTIVDASFTPAQIQQAYGINLVQFGSGAKQIAGTGAGQTIAILEEASEPNITSDLKNFDADFSTSSLNLNTFGSYTGQVVNGEPWFNAITVPGNPASPANAGAGGEISLDVEWAHAIAPLANILEVQFGTDIGAAAAYAASLPGVTVVTSSWFNNDFTENSDFTAPVTFLAASGDLGALQVQGVNGPQTVLDTGFPLGGAESPANEPNVIAVGGTTLTTNSDGSYAGETGWGFVPPVTTSSNPSLAGEGWNTVASGGFQGSYSVGGPNSVAAWTTPITPNDLQFGTTGYSAFQNAVEVSASWPAVASGTTDATYTIYNETTGTNLGSIQVDQSHASSGVADGNGSFQDLGSFTVSNGPTRGSAQFLVGDTLEVFVGDGATGSVVADSIGVGPNGASTGGFSTAESRPAYQSAVNANPTQRAVPDVSFDASADVQVYDSYQGPGLLPNPNPIGFYIGTSLSAPCWAGLIAIADQGLANAGKPALSSSTALSGLYSLPSFDFYHQTSGYNGYQASAGYNLVTGLGSPIANQLLLALDDTVASVTGPLTYQAPEAQGTNNLRLVRNGITIDLYDNGTLVDARPLVLTAAINIDGAGGGTPNMLTVDFSGGDPIPSGGLNYNGTSAGSSMVVNDQSNSAATTYTLTPTTLAITHVATITYSNTSLTLEGGNGKNIYNVQATAAPTILDTGSGNDAINVGNANLLQGLQAPLTVVGQGGTDTLTANDQANAKAQIYGVSATEFGAGLFGSGITYSGMATVVLNGGKAASIYDIESTAAGTAYQVNAAGSNNVFDISASAQDCNAILGAVTLKGGGGTSSLTVNDQANTGNEIYVVTNTVLGVRLFGQAIT